MERKQIPSLTYEPETRKVSLFGLTFPLSLEEARLCDIPTRCIFGTQLPSEYNSHHLKRRSKITQYPGFTKILTEIDPVPAVAIPYHSSSGTVGVRIAALDKHHLVRTTTSQQLTVALLTIEQLAKKMGVSPETLTVQLNNHLDDVMSQFEEKGMDPTKHPIPLLNQQIV